MLYRNFLRIFESNDTSKNKEGISYEIKEKKIYITDNLFLIFGLKL